MRSLSAPCGGGRSQEARTDTIARTGARFGRGLLYAAAALAWASSGVAHLADPGPLATLLCRTHVVAVGPENMTRVVALWAAVELSAAGTLVARMFRSRLVLPIPEIASATLVIALAALDYRFPGWTTDCGCGGVAALLPTYWARVTLAIGLFAVAWFAPRRRFESEPLGLRPRLVRSLTLVSVMLVTAFAAGRGYDPRANPAPIHVVPTEVDIGRVLRGTSLTVTVELVNRSDADRRVEAFIPNCVCLRATPGGESVVVPSFARVNYSVRVETASLHGPFARVALVFVEGWPRPVPVVVRGDVQ